MSFENDRIPKGAIMTQLVGAICEDGKKVITVSDRMVSTGDMTLAFEHPRTKAVPITERAVVLTAGTVHEPDLILQAREQIKEKDRILKIAGILKDVFQQFRERHIVDQILRPRVGIVSFDQWRKEQKELSESIVLDIDSAISRFGLGLWLMLAGVDDEGGHLIRIGHPGVCISYDNLSFCCMGMGERHADNVFAWYRYCQDFPLNDALYIAFEAKKRAEMAGGVGSATDIAILDSDGTKQASADTIMALEEIYDERESRAERTGFDRRIAELAIQATALEASSG